MSSGATSESERGYLSPESKRRFTIVAGVLGAVAFLCQLLLPFAFMLLFMMPATFMRDMKSLGLDEAAIMGDELLAVERTIHIDMKSSSRPDTTLALARIHLADLSDAGPALPLDAVATDSAPELVVARDRLWVFGSTATA